MKRYFCCLFSALTLVVPATGLSESHDSIVTINQKAPVYADHYRDNSKIIFYAQKGEKVTAISVYGNYQVKFPNGDIGWVTPESFEPAKDLLVPEYRIEVAIYSYRGFVRWAQNTSYPALQERFGFPTSLYRNGPFTYTFYTDITVVKDKRHYKGAWIVFEGDEFVKDSLYGNGKRAWYEHLPLASMMRGLNVGRGFNIRNSRPIIALESWGEGNRTFRIIAEVLKWAILAGLFLLPVFLRKYFYTWVLRMRFLPNRIVKILNYLFFYLVFYLVYLFFLSQFFYPIATLYTIVILTGLLYVIRKKEIRKFNHGTIDAKRCSNCGSMGQLHRLKTETVRKEHKVLLNTWKSHVGSDTQTKWVADTKVTVKTDYYEQKGGSYQYTLIHMVDYNSCAKCKHIQLYYWTTTRPGHV